ncbi:hypothetical protein F7Q99_07555 [Streptomyces kaniharaensis]|uniref:RDD domain-containing protein n=1 Tax=Streptomyces kaniharaensis TaxID=212423 RepID=A0A6N7KPV2_9ACTN|nr:RDD family protein [Streptomyces kaniharaensis]MQS12154.1 hypothetical protein [Streptomyces kaniharaensis]
MAQGYPQPQQPYYGQQPPQQQYGYGPNPYAQQPQPQPYPAQGYQQQPQPYPPQGYQQPYAQPEPPPCPEEAYAGRRFLAIVLDFFLALSAGFAAAVATDAAREAKPAVHAAGHAAQHGGGIGVVPFWVAFLGVGLLVSFLNQVVLARLTGFSVGKGILAMRVVRRKGVMRPNMWRLTRRWLIGFIILAVMFLDEDFDVSEGDVVGMRSVRWKHLQEYQQATGRLG